MRMEISLDLSFKIEFWEGQFDPNSDTQFETTKHISVPNLFKTNENRLIGQRSLRIFYHVIWENVSVGSLLPTNMAAGIFNV